MLNLGPFSETNCKTGEESKMVKNQFNLSLSPYLESRNLAVFKWKTRLRVTFTLHNSGVTQNSSHGSIIIHRVDVLKVHDYATQHACLRNYLLIRCPMKVGLRTGEICTLQIENINFENCSFQVLDSKRKRLYPLPLDPVTLSLIQDLIGQREEGYVFTRDVGNRSWSHTHEGKPLGADLVWKTVRKIASEAGVEGFNPRLLRAFFAANWAIVEHKNLEVLRQILRHKSLAYTQFYISRLTFWEDIQAEYQGVQNGPFKQSQVCSDCDNLVVCKYADRMSWWATGCSFKKQRKELVKNE